MGRRKLGLLVSALLLLSFLVIFLHSRCCGRTEAENGGAVSRPPPEARKLYDAASSRHHLARDRSSRLPLSRPLSRTAAAARSMAPAAVARQLTRESHGDEVCELPVSGGFALALSFHDQQTWACGNLYSLQNWASSLNLSVLEPFLLSTQLGIETAPGQSPHQLPLSTLYDMHHWNEVGRLDGNSPTVSWSCFLHQAPKKLVLVKNGLVVRGCNTASLRTQTNFLVELFGFRVIRELCLPATSSSSSRLSVTEFNQRILGGLTAREVTIVYSEWSQHTVGSILDLSSAHIPVALSRVLPLRPSKMIERDADAYISRYLNGGQFVAVLFRSEWLKMYSGVAEFNETLHECLENTLNSMKRAGESSETQAVFLGLDVGKYGSVTVEPAKEKLTREALGKNLLPLTQFNSFATWEQSFDSVSQHPVPGYVALLQRTIAARGSCLLLMGSGSFLRQALEQYKSTHSQSRLCYLTTEGKCNTFRKVGF